MGFYNKDIGYIPFEGYDVGGDGMGYYVYGKDVIGLRGYENGSLTPSNGGNIYNKFTLELRHPITLSESATIYALTFLEAGKAWHEFKAYNPFSVNRSAGFGLRIFLPMLGLMGFDWGYGFDAVPGNADASGSQFHFVLGQQF